MNQHTPGPWRFHDDQWIEGAEEAPNYRKLIADLPRHRIGSADRVAQISEREANARLIAKAPEMFALIGAWVDKGLLDGIALEDARALLKEINDL